MTSIFSKIASGEIPAYKVAESNDFLAFLDVNPLVKGHVLVIPKKETDYIFDVEDEEFKNLFAFAKNVAKAIKKVISCKRIGVAVIGLEVPHAHIHLIPISKMKDMDFSNEKLQLTKDEFLEISAKIIEAFKNA
jgi:histidine triad (HIT) family protein